MESSVDEEEEEDEEDEEEEEEVEALPRLISGGLLLSSSRVAYVFFGVSVLCDMSIEVGSDEGELPMEIGRCLSSSIASLSLWMVSFLLFVRAALISWDSVGSSTCISFVTSVSIALEPEEAGAVAREVVCLARAKRSALSSSCVSFNLRRVLFVVFAAVDMEKPVNIGPSSDFWWSRSS